MSALTDVDAEALGRRRGDSADAGAAAYRYGVVFLIVLTAVVFTIVAGDGEGSWAAGFALVGTALLVVISTSRERTTVRRRRASAGAVVILIVSLGIAFGGVPRNIAFIVTAILTLAIPVTLGGGLLRLVREQGVTLQAVAGALAIYLLAGFAFASLIGFVAGVGSGNYYAQGTNGTASEHLYYSFTVLTTTGFGDFTAAHGVGRALAVIEMLTGQLYLVTVIGILIGRRVGEAPGSAR